MTGMVGDMTVNVEILRASAGAGFTTATDIADWCVRALKMPFRRAHHVAGSLVKLAEDKGVGLEDLTLDEMRAIEPGVTPEAQAVLTVDSSVASRTSFGGTAPSRVREAVAAARAALAAESAS
jgi:argininosuccinate lyase